MRQFIGLISTLLMLFLLPSNELKAQKEGNLTIKGTTVDIDGKPISDVKITLRQGDFTSKTETTNKVGKFSIDIPYQMKYDLVFEKEDYLLTFAGIDANIDSSKINKSFTYILQYIMFKQDSSMLDLNLSNLSKKPFLVINYSYIERKFVQDEAATSSFIADAYEPEGMTLKGIVLDQNRSPRSEVEVRIFNSLTNALMDTIKTDEEGKFEYKIVHNSRARFEIEDENHHPVFMEVKTNLKNQFVKKEFEHQQQIELIPLTQSNINPKAFKQPIHQIIFDDQKNEFKTEIKTNNEFMAVLQAPESFPLKLKGSIETDTSTNPQGTKVILYDTKTKEIINVAFADSNGNYQINTPEKNGLDVRFEKQGFLPALVEVDAQILDSTEIIKDIKVPTLKLIDEAASEIAPELENEVAFQMRYDRDKRTLVVDSSKFKENQEKLIAIEDSINKMKLIDTFDYKKYPYNNLLLDGIISDENNEFLSGVDVSLYHENGKLLTKTKTDKEGAYNIMAPYNHRTLLRYERKKFKGYEMVIDGHINTDETKDLEKQRKANIPQLPLYSFNFLEKNKLNPDAFNDPVTEISFNGKKFQEDADMIAELQSKIRTEFVSRKITINGNIANLARNEYKDIQLLVEEAGQVIDTISIDSKGNYAIDLNYNKSYKLKVISPKHYPAVVLVNTSTETPKLEQVNKKFSANDMTLVKNDGLPIDEMVFAMPVQRIYIDPIGDLIRTDRAVANNFNEALADAIAEAQVYNTAIVFKGRVRGENERRISGVKVYLKEFENIVDSAITDRRGGFEVTAGFEKIYKLVFADDKYYSSYIEINSKAPKSKIQEMSVNLSDVQLVAKDTLIDESVFLTPYSSIAFNNEDDKFEENDKLPEQFLAKAYAPKKAFEARLAREKAIADSTQAALAALQKKTTDEDDNNATKQKNEVKEIAIETNEVKQKKSREKKVKDSNEPEITAQSLLENNNKTETKKTINQDLKVGNNMDLAQISSQLNRPSLAIPKIENTTLSLSNLQGREIKAISVRERAEVLQTDNKQESRNEQAKILNEIIAFSTLSYLRRNVEKIAYDSTLSLSNFININERNEGMGVRQLEIFEIYFNGQLLQFTEIIHWFTYSEYFRNGQKIKEEEYINELTKYRQLAQKN